MLGLKNSVNSVAAEYSINTNLVSDDLIGEMVRYGASELHLVAAIIGGIAAQEALKLMTAQFVPLQGTLIFNGMSGTSLVVDL